MARRKPNIELLDATLAEVRKAARRRTQSAKKPGWDQEVYRDRCGTAMCFAGWALTLDGRTWANTVHPDEGEDMVLARPREKDAVQTEDGKARVIDAETAAERLLGLSYRTALRLFSPSNSLVDLADIVGQIKAGELR